MENFIEFPCTQGAGIGDLYSKQDVRLLQSCIVCCVKQYVAICVYLQIVIFFSLWIWSQFRHIWARELQLPISEQQYQPSKLHGLGREICPKNSKDIGEEGPYEWSEMQSTWDYLLYLSKTRLFARTLHSHRLRCFKHGQCSGALPQKRAQNEQLEDTVGAPRFYKSTGALRSLGRNCLHCTYFKPVSHSHWLLSLEALMQHFNAHKWTAVCRSHGGLTSETGMDGITTDDIFLPPSPSLFLWLWVLAWEGFLRHAGHPSREFTENGLQTVQRFELAIGYIAKLSFPAIFDLLWLMCWFISWLHGMHHMIIMIIMITHHLRPRRFVRLLCGCCHDPFPLRGRACAGAVCGRGMWRNRWGVAMVLPKV